MAEQPTVVNQEASQAPVESTPTTPTEQGTPASEGVNTQAPDVAENLKRALQAEREEKKQLKAALEAAQRQAPTTPAPAPQAPEQNDVERTFYQTVADVSLMKLVAKDAFIRENLDLIENEIAQTGADPLSAANAVKARIFDKTMQETKGQATTQVPPVQLNSTPLPEQQRPEFTGNAYQDAIAGKITDMNDEEKALVEALRQA